MIEMVFGVALVVLSVAAFFSGEPASLTTEGRGAIFFAFGIGAVMLVTNGLKVLSERSAVTPTPVAPSTPTLVCHQCGKVMHADFKVCPFCGTPRQLQCPQCQGAIESTYNLCPHCGHRLKDIK